MDILFEHPWWIISIGVSIEVVLAIILLITRRGTLLWWMLGVLAVTLLSLLIERLVVTDRERIEATLYGGAAALEANDLQRVLSYFPKEAQEARNVVTMIMQRFEVQTARIYNLEIKIDMQSKPPAAKATFLAFASYHDRKGEMPYDNYASNLIVDLRKHGDMWALTGHIEEQNREGKDKIIGIKD